MGQCWANQKEHSRAGRQQLESSVRKHGILQIATPGATLLVLFSVTGCYSVVVLNS